MKNRIVGIDLGTTFSLVSTMKDGAPIVLPNAVGELLTPSAVRCRGSSARSSSVGSHGFFGRALPDASSIDTLIRGGRRVAGISIDLVGWPIVVSTMRGDPTMPELDVYLEAFTRDVLGRRATFVSIVDATRITKAPDACMRQRIADWEQANAKDGAKWSLGVAIVTTSATVRGAMTAINWIYPPPVPTVYEPRLRDALAWAERAITKHSATQASDGAR